MTTDHDRARNAFPGAFNSDGTPTQADLLAERLKELASRPRQFGGSVAVWPGLLLELAASAAALAKQQASPEALPVAEAFAGAVPFELDGEKVEQLYQLHTESGYKAFNYRGFARLVADYVSTHCTPLHQVREQAALPEGLIEALRSGRQADADGCMVIVSREACEKAADMLSQGTTPAAGVEELQSRVAPWLQACFGPVISADKVERNHRFLEEALELVQACGCTQSEAHQLVDYVFGRPVGERSQEVGGVMITLAALCLAQGLNMHEAGETELARIWTMVEKIRAKQAAKPKHSPLPQAAGVGEQATGGEPWPHISSDEAGAATMEWWNGERKLTLYTVSPPYEALIKSWSEDAGHITAFVPTNDAAQVEAAFEWLRAAPKPARAEPMSDAIYDAMPPSAADWLSQSSEAASRDWHQGWEACRNWVTARVRSLAEAGIKEKT